LEEKPLKWTRPQEGFSLQRQGYRIESAKRSYRVRLQDVTRVRAEKFAEPGEAPEVEAADEVDFLASG